MKRSTKIFTITVILSSSLTIAVAQDPVQPLFDYTLVGPLPRHEQHFPHIKSNNELKMFFQGIYLFYKYFISSQDNGRCTFNPSCSSYALLSIEKHGVVVGMLAGFDRLTRCHGLARNKYPIDKETGLYIDEP